MWGGNERWTVGNGRDKEEEWWGPYRIFRQEKEDKEREDTVFASMADVSLAGQEHPELNAAIQA